MYSKNMFDFVKNEILGWDHCNVNDYFQSTKGGGHGDYHLIVLAPSTPQELYDLTMDSFDYAER